MRVLELERVRLSPGERPDIGHIVSANQALGLIAADEDSNDVAEQYLWQAAFYSQFLPTHKLPLYRNICSFWFRSGQSDKESKMCVDGVLDDANSAVRSKISEMLPKQESQ